MLLTIFLSLISLNTQAAQPNWLCSEMNSLRRGGSILACGTATNNDRSEAEKAAFYKALEEFNQVCGVSDDCANHRVSADPKRTVCSQAKGFYTCTRLVEFIIGSITIVDGKQLPTPSSYKIRNGMTKQQILKILGVPNGTYSYSGKVQWVYVENSNCNFDRACSVMFENGKVVQYQDFKPEITEDLL